MRTFFRGEDLEAWTQWKEEVLHLEDLHCSERPWHLWFSCPAFSTKHCRCSSWLYNHPASISHTPTCAPSQPYIVYKRLTISREEQTLNHLTSEKVACSFSEQLQPLNKFQTKETQTNSQLLSSKGMRVQINITAVGQKHQQWQQRTRNIENTHVWFFMH